MCRQSGMPGWLWRAVSDGAVQEALCGSLLLSTMQALIPSSGQPCAAQSCKAAHTIITSGLQSAALAPVLAKVVPQLSAADKERLRSGLRDGGRSCAAERAMPAKAASGALQIDFAAFQTFK